MFQSNSNLERSGFPERPPGTPGAGGFAAPQPARTEDAETSKIPVLGKTLLFRGELTAEEDVILQGRVEGSIRHARNLIIGSEGSVLGDVYASHLTVEGLVEGDLHCSEAVVVRATAQVRGNIFAPRVGIMEGATFNGRVEMDPGAASGHAGARSSGSRQSSAPARTPAASPSASTRAAAPAGNPTVRGTPAAPPTQSAAAPLSSSAVDQVLNAPGGVKK
jgi:cytoskeletal protein CcmA (bactofilin family)